MRILRLMTVLAALSAACATAESGSRFNAKVITLNNGARDASGIQPVAGAKLTLQCPNQQAVDLGTTDEAGRLKADAAIAPSRDCDVNVEQSGYKTASYKVSQVCLEGSATVCRSMDLSAVVQRTGSAGDTR